MVWCVPGGVPAKDLGPINVWWISGFEGGEHPIVSFGTAYGKYVLMEPSAEYAPYMEAMKEKTFLCKLVIELLMAKPDTAYEDLLNQLQMTVPPVGLAMLTEDNLLRHVQFVCDQVTRFDSLAEPEDTLLITSPCMRALVILAGVDFNTRQKLRRTARKVYNTRKTAENRWSGSTMTFLVQNMFETFFPDQLDKDAKDRGPRKRGCGGSEVCEQPGDCGSCAACKDMLKFGGTSHCKQACLVRRCPNMAIQDADDSDPEEEEEAPGAQDLPNQPIKREILDLKREVTWVGDPLKENRRAYYSEALVGGQEIHPGDYVLIKPDRPSQPLYVAQVMYLFQSMLGVNMFHLQWFM
uniref:Uncharacterized protein n=1 Tax=Timema poppense TaxID=170557 RepID=A0A7R9DN96_TIMPO|nr:unnamed protein product [Timema poppensis]